MIFFPKKLVFIIPKISDHALLMIAIIKYGIAKFLICFMNYWRTVKTISLYQTLIIIQQLYEHQANKFAFAHCKDIRSPPLDSKTFYVYGNM